MRLVLNNSYSQLQGLTNETFAKLKKLLSYTPENYGAVSRGFRPRPRYLIDSKGFFPSGLKSRVLGFIVDHKLPVEIVDTRQLPKVKVDHKPAINLKPYPSQLKAVEELVKYKQGTISMPTGSGKAFVIALIIARLSVRTLVVVPTLELKKQLTESLLSVFSDMSNITVENIDSNALQTASNYDLLVIDECHHSAAQTYRTLNKKTWGGIYYRALLTATPFRNNDSERLLFESIAGDVIYRLSYKDAVKEGYIVPVEAYYLEIPKVENDYYSWQEVYSKLVVNHTERNMLISVLLGRLQQAGKATLCLVKEVAHGRAISEMTGIPFVHGQDEDSRDYIRQFNSGGIKAVIGTTGVLGEGVDSKPCEYVIIAGLGKAKSQLMQQIGRSVRKFDGKESGKVILIKDKSHKFTLRHFRNQIKVLKDEYGVVPQKLEL